MFKQPLALFALGFVATGIVTVSAKAQSPQPQTRADMMAKLQENYRTLDANNDGAVDKAEVEAAQARAVRDAQAAVNKKLEEEFVRLDTNKDKALSMAEFRAAASARATVAPAETLQRLDSNKDGKISVDEFRARAVAAFDQIDTNKDGTLSVDEQRAAAAAQGRR